MQPAEMFRILLAHFRFLASNLVQLSLMYQNLSLQSDSFYDASGGACPRQGVIWAREKKISQILFRFSGEQTECNDPTFLREQLPVSL